MAEYINVTTLNLLAKQVLEQWHSVNCIITSPAYTDYNNLCRGLSFI